MNTQLFFLGDTAYYRYDDVVVCGIITDYQDEGAWQEGGSKWVYKLTLENTRQYVCDEEHLFSIDLDVLVNL